MTPAEENEWYDVVVVGGGVVGWSAAKVAHQTGASVLLIEERNGLGGSWHSMKVEGFTCDNGLLLMPEDLAAAGRWPVPSGLREAPRGKLDPDLVVHAGGGRVVVPVDQLTSSGDQLSQWFTVWPAMDQEWRVSSFGMRNFWGGWTPEFFADVVMPVYRGFAAESLGVASTNLVNDAFRDLLLMGHISIARFGFLESPFISDADAAGIDVRLNCRVENIEAHREGVVLRHSRGITRARSVAVALDPVDSAELIGSPAPDPVGGVATYWFAARAALGDSRRLHIGCGLPGRVARSLAVSNVAPERAPRGYGLVAASVIVEGGAMPDDRSVVAEVAAHHDADPNSWHLLIRQYHPGAGIPRLRTNLTTRHHGRMVSPLPAFSLSGAIQEGALAGLTAIRALGPGYRLRALAIALRRDRSARKRK